MAEPQREPVPVSEERYRQLTACLEANWRCRAPAVEEARLWCQVNKGTATLEEGLRACTPDELYYLAGINIYRDDHTQGGYGTPDLYIYLYWAAQWLNARAEAAKTARDQGKQMTHIMPGGEENG